MKSLRILQNRYFSIFFLLVCSLLLYITTFSASWTMDDYVVIVNNSDIRSVGNFLANSQPGRPLRELSYLIDHFFFGLTPRGYHFQNIFWHALNCWLVYLVALRLKLGNTAAWLSSLLFLVHPVHVEVVANSSHRKDSLALAFLLMAFLSLMRMYDNISRSQLLLWGTVTVVLWLTAFFAKGNSLVFPAIIVAYEYALVPENKRFVLRWKHSVTFIYLCSVIGLTGWYWYISALPAFRLEVIAAFVKSGDISSFSLSAYLLMVLKSFAFMASKLVLPVNLSMEYVYPAPKSIIDPWVVSALVLIPAICYAVWRWKRTSPQLLFLLGFSLIFWLPTANIFWHLSYFAADRYMYAPSAGLCLLVVFASGRACSGSPRLYAVIWLCVLSLCTALTWRQTRYWLNETALYTHMLEVSPRALEAMVGLANAYYLAKDYDTSVRYARMAIERDFTDFRPYLTMGNIAFAGGRLDDARALLLESQNRNPLSPEVHNALGSVLDDLGESGRAIESYKAALGLRPEYVEALTNLGVAYERRNSFPEAEAALRKALSIDNDYISAWYNLGIVNYRRGDRNGARTAFSEAVKRAPTRVDALTNLSVVCRELRDDACHNDATQRLSVIAPGDAGAYGRK